MESYIVSARKYRPATFDTVVGQSSLTTTLKNSIQSGRLAHAYLFCGPRGVGKTTCARIFAKTINCLQPQSNGEACNECESCKAFIENRSYNIHELDAASNNGVDDIKTLMDQVLVPPQVGKYKVFIIDEVHMLSTAAFNAFLKTLEEPPSYVIFILATTEKHKLLPTILSRCQIYDFSRMSVPDIVHHLENVAQKEGITAEPAALNVIAQKADGGMRDALSIFDQVASFCQGNITYQATIEDLNVLDYDYYFKLVDYFLANKVPEIMVTLNDILCKGFEGSHFINGLNNHFRNLLVSRDAQTLKLMEVSDDVKLRYQQQAQQCNQKFLYAAIRRCTDCDLNYRMSQNKRLLVEITLIEVAQLAQDPDAYSGRKPRKVLKPVFQQQAQSVADPRAAQQKQAPASAPIANQAQSATQQTANVQTQSPAQQTNQERHALQSISQGISATQRTPIPGVQEKRPVAMGFSLKRALSGDLQTDQTNGGNVEHNSVVVNQQIKTILKPGETLDTPSLIIGWRSYVESIKESDPSVSKRLGNIEPILLEHNVVEVISDNPMMTNDLEKQIAAIQRYLQTTLSQPALQLRIRQREQADRPKIMSKQQIFASMCERNDALLKLRETFSLELT